MKQAITKKQMASILAVWILIIVSLIIYLIGSAGCADDQLCNTETVTVEDCTMNIELLHLVNNAVEVFNAEFRRFEADETNYYVIQEESTTPFIKDSVVSINIYKCK